MALKFAGTANFVIGATVGNVGTLKQKKYGRQTKEMDVTTLTGKCFKLIGIMLPQ